MPDSFKKHLNTIQDKLELKTFGFSIVAKQEHERHDTVESLAGSPRQPDQQVKAEKDEAEEVTFQEHHGSGFENFKGSDMQELSAETVDNSAEAKASSTAELFSENATFEAI